MASGFTIGAPHSGAGKTTITLAILAALTRRGLAVAPFKVGPDYIDPAHHQAVTGRASHNLDTWMCSHETAREIFRRGAKEADVAVVEGVMGLFDGSSATGPEGSTAELSRVLGLPAVLVVNARSMARSAAALVAGFARFDPHLKMAGVILNQVGSPSHRRILEEALAAEGLPPVVGAVERADLLAMPERHLGLVTPGDLGLPADRVAVLAGLAERSIDLDRLLALTKVAPIAPGAGAVAPASRPAHARRLAVARDRAYCFYYEENFRVLERWGAELVFFRPAEGEPVPAGVDGLYLGGGYPELHAERISANGGFLQGIRDLHAAGVPIYAECGGFMTLCRELVTAGGTYPMAGIFDAATRMEGKRFRLGYREVTGARGSALEGVTARGHEFHYSHVEELPGDVARDWRVTNARGEALAPEGYRVGATTGGYIHLHFGSNPEAARRLLGL